MAGVGAFRLITTAAIGILLIGLSAAGPVKAAEGEVPLDITYTKAPDAPAFQHSEQAEMKSAGCVSCHTASDEKTMHVNPGVILGCVDCHGGDFNVRKPDGTAKGDQAYQDAMFKAHIQPRYPVTWDYPKSRNPIRSYTLLNKEAPEYIRFVNPSDYRVVREACGVCHLPQINAAERSLMSTGAMLWGGAAYNNGILPYKKYIVGEAYTREGVPSGVKHPGTEPLTEEMEKRGILPQLLPMPAFEVIPPGDIFRVFERGGKNIINLFPEIGLPNALGQTQRLEEPGRPDLRQSNRGPGTGLRIAVPVLNVHKTRLNDPFTWFMGTNDQPGDFRTSGCASCHVVYANDRDPLHSGPYSQYGHWGQTQTVDPTIPKDERGHPLQHVFTRAIPTSQCMVCHMHQPNIFLNSYLGYTMWDYESDAPAMWPEEQRYPTHAEMHEILERNPEEAAIRGLWGDVEFTANVTDLNPTLNNTQFADYHGHGWNFRGIFKKDRKGNLLDAEGGIVEPDDPNKWDKAVHMRSIHAEVGMHCVDCHFAGDAHGNGYIHGEVAAAIEIRCKDCHGTVDSQPTLITSGPARLNGGRDLSLLRLQDGRARFEWRGSQCENPVTEDRDCRLYQRSALWPDREWEVSLVKDSVTPGNAQYNEKAARSKLMSKDRSMEWGLGVAANMEDRAHRDDEMMCFTCHLSWTTSCAGCHLPIQANWKTERHHYEGGITRNFATYNPQVARDQMFQLGVGSSVKGNLVFPIRSTSALVLSSQNINRERIYIQQPPIASPGYSSQAFAPHFPHTARKTETKTCTDCHLSDKNDNNAIMAQLLLHGTNFVNFVGFNAWVGQEGGFEAIPVTEWDEPQAVIGSYLHRYAYPDWYKEHEARGRKLKESYKQSGWRTGCIQLRGEYLFVAEGTNGFQAYDVASIANKGFSDRIITAPFGPSGHNTRIDTENATCMALPTNQNIAPQRQTATEEMRKLHQEVNEEQPFHPIYNYAFITDAVEGLIVTDVNNLADGDPLNNFFTRALTWNENGILTGAQHITIAGYYFYISTPTGVVILNMNDPMAPKVVKKLPFNDVRATALQFRYLLVTDAEGLKVVNVTIPEQAEVVPGAVVPMDDAQKIYIARTYAYVAAKSQGLAIIDVENPEAPKLYEMFTADGQINDARDVVVATTNASLIGYVADGKNGLKVIQLTSPESQPRFYGFSPEPKPQLIAWWPTPTPSLSLSKGMDRDRAVDETGGQMAVFGRLGSRPFNLQEQREFYLDENLRPWTVTDDVEMNRFVPRNGPRQQNATTPSDDRRVQEPADDGNTAEAPGDKRAALVPNGQDSETAQR